MEKRWFHPFSWCAQYSQVVVLSVWIAFVGNGTVEHRVINTLRKSMVLVRAELLQCIFKGSMDWKQLTRIISLRFCKYHGQSRYTDLRWKPTRWVVPGKFWFMSSLISDRYYCSEENSMHTSHNYLNSSEWKLKTLQFEEYPFYFGMLVGTGKCRWTGVSHEVRFIESV